MTEIPVPQPILTEDGKFSGDNLWKIRDSKDPDAIITKKADYFRWSRDWGFASEKAGNNSAEYEYAIACLVQDQAAAGLKIDVNKSQGDKLVAYPQGLSSSVDMDEARKYARKILGIKGNAAPRR